MTWYVPAEAKIASWTIRYYEPTYGMREFTVSPHADLVKARAWLDEGGFAYSHTPYLPKGR